MRVFSLFAGSACHEELVQQGRFHFHSPLSAHRYFESKGRSAAEPVQNPVAQGGTRTESIHPHVKTWPQMPWVSFLVGGVSQQLSRNSGDAQVCGGLALSGGLGGLHPLSPTQNNRPSYLGWDIG